jgi:ABC-type phosphate transport system permease subunit
MFNLILAVQEKDINEIVKPLLQVLSVVTPVLLAVVGAIGAIFVIILGVKYARADDPQEHEKAKKGLRNAIIGFVLIFVLLIALQVAVSVFTNWYKTYEYPIIG